MRRKIRKRGWPADLTDAGRIFDGYPLLRVITVSLKTMKIVNGLPALGEFAAESAQT